MKFTIFSILLIAVIFLVACNQKAGEKLTETPTPEKPPVEVTTPTVETKPAVEMKPSAEQGKGDREVYKMVNFKKTACYGKCPVYEVEIYNDGRVVYNGKRFVDRLGIHKATITEKEVKMIRSEFDKVGFIDFAGEYPINGQKISDLPSTIIEYRAGDMIKVVKDKHDAPEQLKKFEAWLAEYIDGLTYKVSN